MRFLQRKKTTTPTTDAPAVIECMTARTVTIECETSGSKVSNFTELHRQDSAYKLWIGYNEITVADSCAVFHQRRHGNSGYYLADSVSIERCGAQFRIMPAENPKPEFLLLRLKADLYAYLSLRKRLTVEQLLMVRKRSRRAEYLLLLKPGDEVHINTFKEGNSLDEIITVSEDLTISISKREIAESQWMTNSGTAIPAVDLTAVPRVNKRIARKELENYSNHPALAGPQQKLMEELAQHNKKQRAEDAINFLLPVVNALQAYNGAVRDSKSIEAVTETLTRAEAHYATVVWAEEKRALKLVRESFDYLRQVLKQWPHDADPLNAAELIENMAAIVAEPIRILELGEVVTGVPSIEFGYTSTA